MPENIITAPGGKKLCRHCRAANERRNGRRGPLRKCGCGALFPASGRTIMCPACTDSAARRAADLHTAGDVSWDEVASQVGYQSAWGAAYAAKRIGYVAEPRPRTPPQPRPAKLCECGAPVPAGPRGKNRSVCDDCACAAARRAAELRRAGHTLRAIADELGYSSITSVTNLLKTVGVESSGMGRPRLDRARKPAAA